MTAFFISAEQKSKFEQNSVKNFSLGFDGYTESSIWTQTLTP